MTPVPAKASTLDKLAIDIRREHAQTIEGIRTTLTGAVRCGQLLLEAKALVHHGDFLAWMEKKCRLSRQTCQAYMRMARHFGSDKASNLAFCPTSIRQGLRMLARTAPADDGGNYLDRADQSAPLPSVPVARLGDVWSLGPHRLLCADATDAVAVARLIGDRKPILMVTDPPYGVALDSIWRNHAHISEGLRDTPGHQETTMVGDSRTEWSEAFALVSSIQVGYVFHASSLTSAIFEGLRRIGFEHFQAIVWDKGRSVFGRTHYSYQHEAIWYARKQSAPWYGELGSQSTIWTAPSPKFQSGSEEEKFDHPTQKPVALMIRPIENHTREGELVYDPFVGSGTTIAAAEVTGRICCGIEIDPKHVDVAIQRWQALTGRPATLAGRSFDAVARERLGREAAKRIAAG